MFLRKSISIWHDGGLICKSGMWMVRPAATEDGQPEVLVIHLDCVFRAAHLLPIYGDIPTPDNVSLYNSLDAFVGFYVNKYADHHAFEIAYY